MVEWLDSKIVMNVASNMSQMMITSLIKDILKTPTEIPPNPCFSNNKTNSNDLKHFYGSSPEFSGYNRSEVIVNPFRHHEYSQNAQIVPR